MLRALKPKGYPENPTTLGEHLRKRRKELGLTLEGAADQIGVSPGTVMAMEQGRLLAPSMATFSEVLSFLGYYPYAVSNLEERLLKLRRINGWTLPQAARKAKAHAEAWSRWERGFPIRYRPHRAAVAKLLDRAGIT